jgi:hypothetical protein
MPGGPVRGWRFLVVLASGQCVGLIDDRVDHYRCELEERPAAASAEPADGGRRSGVTVEADVVGQPHYPVDPAGEFRRRRPRLRGPSAPAS